MNYNFENLLSKTESCLCMKSKLLMIVRLFRKKKLRWLKVEQRLVDLDIAVKTSLHLERPTPEECITALDELNELALAPLMLKKQPDIVTTIRFVNSIS